MDNNSESNEIHLPRRLKDLTLPLISLAGTLCCLLPVMVMIAAAIPKGSTCQNGVLTTDLGMFGTSELSVAPDGDVLFDTPNGGWNVRIGGYANYYGVRTVVVFDRTNDRWIFTYMADTPGQSYGDLKHGIEIPYRDLLEKCSGTDLDSD